MSDELIIRKVKVLPKKAQIKVDYMLNGDEVSATFNEAPRPEFYECLKKLGPSVCEILELAPADFADRLTPFGATYSHGEDAMRASVQCKLYMPESGTETVINTPMRNLNPEAEDGLSTYACNLLDRLMEEARLYVNGKRAQGELFDEGEQDVTPAPLAIAQ